MSNYFYAVTGIILCYYFLKFAFAFIDKVQDRFCSLSIPEINVKLKFDDDDVDKRFSDSIDKETIH